MSFQGLNSALTGLRVAQQQLSVISNNISNVNTSGYSRKILPQSTQVIHSTGDSIGVRADTMIRKVDLNLERELWTQVSSVAALDIKGAYLDTIEKFHGSSQKEISIAAHIAQLKDKFAALSDSPSSGALLQSTLDQASQVARKFNEFGNMITEMRNDAQNEIERDLVQVNTLLSSIAEINKQVKAANTIGRSTAAMQDKRDEAVKELAGYMDISFFMRGDGVMVVQTRDGVQLTDENPADLYFDPPPLTPTTVYPTTSTGIYVGGNPIKHPTAIDITARGIGGKIGGLFELRDDILVQYQAQTDELAHKLAMRMEAQGLRLFTDAMGVVPPDTAPDPDANPPVSVTYVGFASIIQVNDDIRDNITLIQQGTYDSERIIPASSNEIIRRVIQFGFGDVHYQEAEGVIDLNHTAPASDLQTWLGLSSKNNVVGGTNLANFSQIDDGVVGTPDLMADLDQFFPNYPDDDQFQITFSEPRLGLGPVTITIDLSDASTNHPIGGSVNSALDQIINEINDQITAAGLPAGLTASATRNSYGQLSIQSNGNVQLDASSFVGAMGTEAFSALGWREDTYVTEDPYFDVHVGNNNPVRITIAPGDDINTLISKMEYNTATGTGVPGLHVDFDAATGRLTLRPGMDDTNTGPKFGGDIRLVSGPGASSGAINPTLAALPAGVNVISALFGSYSVSGTTVTNTSPITDVPYESETFAGSGVFVGYRRDYLGANAGFSSNILTGTSIIDYSQKMINIQMQDIIKNSSAKEDQASLKDLLQERLLNESGVNIDEELSNLIVIQTAYAAAARAVTAADEMFRDLLSAI
jgi:flagellar hook-associated protein 1 FlgK